MVMLEHAQTGDALTADAAAILEKVIVGGDLSKLSGAERMAYYRRVCESLSLNPLTQPFAYVQLRGRGLTLYALKAATDQLRKIHGVSITRLDVTYQDDLVVVTVTATDRTGRTDTDVGVVALGKLSGEDRANAVLKSVTKAKRRVTLSICGLGMLDETEIEAIPGSEVVVEQSTPATHSRREQDPETVTTPEPATVSRAGTSGGSPEPRSAADWTREQLGARIREACDLPLTSGQDWANLARLHGQPVPTSREAMTRDWLLALYQAVRASAYAAAIPAAAREEDVTGLVAEALGDVDRRHITMEQYHRLREAGEARKAELASPLLAGAPLEVAS